VLSVYTTNGRCVRSRLLHGPLAAWASWTSEDGFDWIVIADEKGALEYAEVELLDFAEVKACGVAPPVMAVRYTPLEGGIVAVSGRGEVTFWPCAL
jgi:hypothetical protein